MSAFVVYVDFDAGPWGDDQDAETHIRELLRDRLAGSGVRWEITGSDTCGTGEFCEGLNAEEEAR